jgi:aryl carrier-like protein
LQVFLDEPSAPSCTSLRRVIASGEALAVELVRHFVAVLDAELHNLYGPTEAAIDVTAYACPRRGVPLVIPIGRAIANTRLYVRDRLGRLVPPGVPGELFIGGVGVALGYHARPALNAEKFLPSPYFPGERLFRTGDLVRYDRDGQLEYLGRIDQQVKIRGYRIELGELEARLRSHPLVREAAVIVDGEQLTERRLIAYVVADQPIEVAALRAFLRASLPEPMLPGEFMQLERLPLSVNGKLDRRALPRPQRNAERPYAAPETEHERALCAVWAEVLKLDRVGAEDNFFELGGDSIRCIRARARARTLGLDFEVAEMFAHQTVRALAPLVRPVEVHAALMPFELLAAADRAAIPAHVLDAYPLARLQAGMIFHSEFSPDSSFYQVVLSFHLEGKLDIELLRRSAATVVSRHDILRTSFVLGAHSEPLQLVQSEAVVEIPYTDLQAL